MIYIVVINSIYKYIYIYMNTLKIIDSWYNQSNQLIY